MAGSPTSTASRSPNAQVSVWQTGADGLYDIQVDASDRLSRRIHHRCAGQLRAAHRQPIGYSIPMDGPVGELVSAQGRHGMRPAHIHFLVGAPGYRELVTALYVRDDPHIADDVVFGSSADLAAELTARRSELAP